MVTTIEGAELIKTDRLGRIQVKPEHREALLDKFEQSGVSGQQFAKQHGIKYPTFANWRQKRKRMGGLYPEQVQDTPSALLNSLTEVVPVTQTKTKSQSLRVALGGSIHIEVSNEAEVTLAAKLIKELQSYVSQQR